MNNRPWFPFLAAVAVGAFLSLLAVGVPQVGGQTPPLTDDEAALSTLINDYRAQNGLSPLGVSPTLTAAARWMSEDMAEHNYFSHIDSLGRNPWERMTAFGYAGASMGEIIGAGYSTPEGAFEGWRNSPAHNAIMLTPGFVVAGVGQAYNPQSPYGWYWTVDFGDAANIDTDGDTVPDSVDLDDDNDTFGDDVETYLGTDSLDACPDNSSDDVWPFDTNIDREVDILDVVKYIPVLNSCSGDPSYDQRYDLKPDACINILDVVTFIPVLRSNARCTNR